MKPNEIASAKQVDRATKGPALWVVWDQEHVARFKCWQFSRAKAVRRFCELRENDADLHVRYAEPMRPSELTMTIAEMRRDMKAALGELIAKSEAAP